MSEVCNRFIPFYANTTFPKSWEHTRQGWAVVSSATKRNAYWGRVGLHRFRNDGDHYFCCRKLGNVGSFGVWEP